MKNILMLTSLYPSDDVKFFNNTSVCHYFAKEWVKMGYNVRVIFLYYIFPIYYYPLLRFLNKTLATSSSNAILDKYLVKEYSYKIDGVHILRIPIRKSRPGGTFKKDEYIRISSRIESFLHSENFTPDAIVGHFLHPSIDIISLLKDKYPKIVTSISLHGKRERYESLSDQLSRIDYIGYRSVPIGRSFESMYGKKPFFYCFSGVPATYITNNRRSFSNGVHNFIYVGNLMKRKHPHCIIPAVYSLYKEEDFSITYVGDGNEKKTIKKCVKKLKISSKVIFTGRISRELVTKELDKADVFIMISSNETFGLVYLEAMARGCIVVASVDEGMEGIIKDGVNGFLCKAGDSIALEKILIRIKNMSQEELVSMSSEGINTAKKMTDELMATAYINALRGKNNSFGGAY